MGKCKKRTPWVRARALQPRRGSCCKQVKSFIGGVSLGDNILPDFFFFFNPFGYMRCSLSCES